MGGDPGPGHGRDGVPDLTLGVEEGTEGAHPGGDETGHDRGLPTEKENERGTETGTGTGIGDDTLHADERGKISAHVYLQLPINITHTGVMSALFLFHQVPFQLTTGGRLEARISEQWRPSAGRQRQPQSLSVPQSCQPQSLPCSQRSPGLLHQHL